MNPKKPQRKELIAFKLSKEELSTVIDKAMRYTQGNISAYLREAALAYARGDK